MRRMLATGVVVLAMLLSGCATSKPEPVSQVTTQPEASQPTTEEQDQAAAPADGDLAESPADSAAEEPQVEETEDPVAAAFRKATIKSRGEKWLGKFDDVSMGWSRSKIKKALGSPSKTYKMNVPTASGTSQEAACLAYVVGKAPGGGKRWKFVNVDPSTRLFISKGNMEGSIKVSGSTTKYDLSFSGIEY